MQWLDARNTKAA